MPLVSELITKFEADPNNFNRGINNIENKLLKFSKTAAKVGAGIAVAIGTVAVSGFLVLLNIINDTTDRVSHLVDTADRFGASVSGLQKLQFISSLSGGGLAEIEQGMSKLVLTLKALDNGSQSTAKAFDQLSITQDMLKNKKIDEIYLLVIERLKAVTNSTEQAKIASELFGRGWASQINIIKSDISGLSKEFDSFGGALTDKQALAIDSYGDSVTKLSALFDSFKLQLTAQVAPALEEVIKFISKTILEMGGLGPVANVAAQYFVAGLQMAVDSAQRVLDVLHAIHIGFKEAQLQILEFMQSFSEMNFEVFGNDFNFDRLSQITKLKRDIKDLNNTGRLTDPLQSGLERIQNKLQANSNQKIDVRITTEKGLKAEIAQSPEMTKYINSLVERYAEKTN